MQRRARPWLGGLLLALATGCGLAQVVNPVYPDDAPLASATLGQIDEFIAQGSEAEVVRQLVRLLGESGGRVVPSAGDPDLWVPVRQAVHEALLARPGLLERYRAIAGPALARDLESAGTLQEHRAIESVGLLTGAGYEATLRIAQLLMEDARFEAAALALEQLERHPDRRGVRGREAAELAGQIARFIDRESVWQWAARWARESQAPDANADAIEWPAGALEREVSPLVPMQPLDLSEVLATPLHSVVLGDPLASLAESRGGLDEALGGWVFPTVVDDEVYVNDGRFVGRWDRFTLSSRWRVRPRASWQQGMGELDPDEIDFDPTRSGRPLHTVSVYGDRVIAPIRQPVSARESVAWVHGLDRDSGEVVWSWRPERTEGRGAPEPSGPAPVFEGTVVVAAERQLQARRVWSAFLYGLDARSGEVRWRRPLGSAGSLPYLPRGSRESVTVLDRGVAYRTDHLGILSAVEIETGRVLWVRRAPTPAINRNDALPDYAALQPIVRGESVFMVARGGNTLLELDRRTGAIARELGLQFGSTDYLVELAHADVPGGIVAVGQSGLRVLDAADITQRPAGEVQLPMQEAVGRIAALGPVLVMPDEQGLIAMHAGGPRRTWRIDLEHSGNVVAMPGQLLVAQPGGLHSYLVWDVAQRVLRERMASAPRDPDPALTFAELAWQAGRYGEIVGGIDRALAALEAIGPVRGERARAKLMDLVLSMIEAGQRDAARGVSEAESIGVARSRELVERYARVAESAPERVAALIARGAQDELEGDDAGAVASFQAVLDDPELAQALWGGAGLSVRAESEARRRVLEVVSRVGPGAYAPFEQQAASQIAAALDDLDALERTARRYPAAQASARAWLLVAQQRASRGQEGEALRALAQGLETALAAGGPAEVRRELAGRLVRDRVSRGQVALAARTLERIPDATLLDGTREIDRAELESALSGALRAQSRGALVGLPSGTLDVRRDREVIEPVLDATLGGAGPPLRRGVLLLGRGLEDRVGITLATLTDLGKLVDRWSWEGQEPVRVVLATSELVVLHAQERGVGVLIGLSAADGQERWRAGPIGGSSSARLSIPAQGDVRAGDLVLALDAGVLIASERRGETIAIDLASGRELWRREGVVDRVHDLAAGGGVVVLGGAAERGPPGAPTSVLADELVALDLLDGATLSRREIDPGPEGSSGVRWVRVDESGSVLAGLERAVISTNPAQGRSNWVWTAPAAEFTIDAWIGGGRVLVLDASREVWLGSLASGRFERVDELDAMLGMSLSDVVLQEAGGGVRALGDRGMWAIDARGEPVAGGVVGGEADRAETLAGEGVLVVVAQTIDSQGAVRIWHMDQTGKILADPARVVVGAGYEVIGSTLIDGAIVLTVRSGREVRTIAIAAPASGAG